MNGFKVNGPLEGFEDFEKLRGNDPRFSQIDFCDIKEDPYRFFLGKNVRLDLGKNEAREGRYMGAFYDQREIVLGPYVSARSEYLGKNSMFTHLDVSDGPFILTRNSFISIEGIPEDELDKTVDSNSRSRKDFVALIKKESEKEESEKEE